MAEETPPTVPAKGKGKGGNPIQKYKWYIIGGVAGLGLLFVAMKGRGGSGADTGQSASDYASQNAINPATGYLYGSPADLAAQGSGSMQTGIPGPAGPAGPAGPSGPAGGLSNGPGVPKVTLPSSSAGTKSIAHAVSTSKPKRTPVKVSPYYTVKPGDNLSKIAATHHIGGGWQSIYNKNKTVIGKNPNLIHPGQRLVL